MGPAAFVIAILGCADGSAACTPVSTAPARYATEAACSAASPAVLALSLDFDFPTLVAECRAVSPRPAAEPTDRPRRPDVDSREG